MRRNFRIGSTSYVYPGDILPNVRLLAGVVEDVELVLYEVDGYGTNLPDAASIQGLKELSQANDLTFTVHLPADLSFGDAASMDKAWRAIDTTLPLNPLAYVMHLDGRALLSQPTEDVIAKWQETAALALEQVIAWVVEKPRVCVENVEAWDPRYFHDLVTHANVSRCVDVGHFWLRGTDPLPHLLENLPQTRVIHMHGVGSRDHQSLRQAPPADLQAVVEAIMREDYRGVLTLEVFGMEDFFTSLEALQAAIGRSGEKWATAS